MIPIPVTKILYSLPNNLMEPDYIQDLNNIEKTKEHKSLSEYTIKSKLLLMLIMQTTAITSIMFIVL